MNKYVLAIILTFLLVGCSGNLAENQERLDQVYGKCDNPHRVYTKVEKENCIASERASGSGGESRLFDGILSKKEEKITYLGGSNINPFLWQGSLEALQNFPVQIADNNGGYIQTDWIYEPNTPNSRCMIKVNILSSELVSTGVKAKMLCQNRIEDDTWVSDGIEYVEENKSLTLNILSKASTLSNQ